MLNIDVHDLPSDDLYEGLEDFESLPEISKKWNMVIFNKKTIYCTVYRIFK